MEISDEYEYHIIHGVNTIVWKWFKTGSPVAGTKRRKKLKVEIGRKHLVMPVLDIRRSKNHLEFCDIVISRVVVIISAVHNSGNDKKIENYKLPI